MIEELKNSYKNCISNMYKVHPYHETEIQPLYADYWNTHIITPMMKLGNDFEPITPSILRSMMVMDLMDYSFLNLDKGPVYKFYKDQLDKFYTIDKFSLAVNFHKKYQYDDLFDYTFFNTENCKDVILRLYKQCYLKFLDIFADNGYEVIGPIYLKGYTFQIQYFRNLNNNEYKFITYEKGNIPGGVDMFAHSTLQFSINSNIVAEINGAMVLDDMRYIPIEFEKDARTDLEKYVDSRLFRVNKILDRSNIINIIKDKELLPRITDINQLINLL